MRTTKSTIKTEVTYDDEMKNKYLIRKEWDKDKKKALVIMKNAGQADEILQDQTTMYVINNLSKLEYGVVDIVNWNVNTKLDKKLKGLLSKFHRCHIPKCSMNSNVVEPMNIVIKFKGKLFKGRKMSPVSEFCFKYLKHCFSNGIVIRTTLHAQGSLNPKCFECL